MSLCCPSTARPTSEGAKNQAGDDDRPVCLGDNRIREKSDGEPAKERSRQGCGLAGKLHREHEQDINEAGSEL